MANKVGVLIKEARTGAGLTQEQLARKIKGISADDISKAERGEKELTQAVLKEIAKATGVTQKSLLDAAKTARPKSAAKPSAAKPAAAAKKPAVGKTTAAKKPAAAKQTEYTLTATEKKLIDAYRSASAENKKLALNLLQGKAVEDSEGLNVGSILQNSLSSGLGGVLETLISGLGK